MYVNTNNSYITWLDLYKLALIEISCTTLLGARFCLRLEIIDDFISGQILNTYHTF